MRINKLQLFIVIVSVPILVVALIQKNYLVIGTSLVSLFCGCMTLIE